MENMKKRFVLQAQDDVFKGARIKVVGIGGGGSNAVDYMASDLFEDVECYVANTDSQALARSQTSNRLQFGTATTRGRGAGFDPQRGRQAAVEDRQKIVEYVGDAEMVFLTAGLGGGTGTGAAPVFAQAIKEFNPESLVVAVVTMPFSIEGERRMDYARAGARELRQSVDSIITIANDKILTDDIPLFEAFGTANEVLLNAVRGISDVVVRTGFINVDFADVKTIMSEEGLAMMAHGSAYGEERARKVTESVLSNPLLEDVDLADAKGLLVNITASSSISSGEYKEIGERIQDAAPNAEAIVSGLVFDEDVGDEIRVTIVASGLRLPHDERYGKFDYSDFVEDGSAPQEATQDEFEFPQAHEPQEISEPRTFTNPFLDEQEDYVEEEYAAEMSEHVPSILRNRGNLRPDQRLNGSADA